MICIVYTLLFVLCTMPYAPCIMHYALCTINYMYHVHLVLGTLYFVLCTMHYVLCHFTHLDMNIIYSFEEYHIRWIPLFFRWPSALICLLFQLWFDLFALRMLIARSAWCSCNHMARSCCQCSRSSAFQSWIWILAAIENKTIVLYCAYCRRILFTIIDAGMA